ncbi:MAG: hypothetical protein AAF990_23740 [Bacteroidota bacterium]
MLSSFRNFSPFGILATVWLAAIFIVQPFGDFPLNDDWSFGQSALDLARKGRFVLGHWQDMTLLVQLLWGAAFCKLFGSSFIVLRWSVLLLSLWGLWGTYRLGEGLGIAPWHRLLLTACVAFNPWYFSLSFSFMTDVPFYVLLIWSFCYYQKVLVSNRSADFLLGILLAVLATGIRQFGILAPLSFAVAYLWQHRNLRAAGLAALSIAVAFGSLQGYVQYLESIRPLSASFGSFGQLLKQLGDGPRWEELGIRSGQILFYMGLWWLPAALILGWYPTSLRRSWASGLLALMLTLALAYIAWDRLPAGNILNNCFIGPLTLKGAFMGQHTFPSLSPSQMNAFKCLGFAGLFVLLWHWFRRLTYREVNLRSAEFSIRLMSFLAIVLYSGYLLIGFLLWDRYFILLLPLLGLLVFSKSDRAGHWMSRLMGAVLFLAMLLFSIAATHDYLAWNGARWKALNDLEIEKGIPASQIDGGFEFNALRQTNGNERNSISPYGKSWWFVEEDRFVVSFLPMPCYQSRASYTYRRYLPPRVDTIYLNERQRLEVLDSLYLGAEQLAEEQGRDSTRRRSGLFALRLDDVNQYGFAHTYENVHACQRLDISLWRYNPNHSECGLVVAHPNTAVFYTFIRGALQRDEKGWENIEISLTLPTSFLGHKIDIYVWNPGGRAVWFDDLKVFRRE